MLKDSFWDSTLIYNHAQYDNDSYPTNYHPHTSPPKPIRRFFIRLLLLGPPISACLGGRILGTYALYPQQPFPVLPADNPVGRRRKYDPAARILPHFIVEMLTDFY